MSENQESQQFIYANNKQALLSSYVHKHATHSVQIPDSGNPKDDAYLLFLIWCEFTSKVPFYIHYQWNESSTVILTTSEENRDRIRDFVSKYSNAKSPDQSDNLDV